METAKAKAKANTIAQFQHQRKLRLGLEKRLTKMGFQFPEFWDNPLGTIEALTVLRMAELLGKDDMRDSDRIRALKAAHEIHPLGALARLKERAAAVEQFQNEFKKDEVEGKTIEGEKVKPE